MTEHEEFGAAVPPVIGSTPPPPTPSYATTGLSYTDSTSQWAPPQQVEEPSATEVAKDQAASVAGGATDAAKNVAGVAKEQVVQVASEAKKQVKDLVGQARTELTEQAGVQQQRVASGLKSVGDQLRAMAEGSTEQGPATDIAHQAADKVHQIAEFFENRDPGSVLDEVRSFARKQPGAFLAISLGAGILAGRLARGLAADTDNSTSATPSSSGPAVTAGYSARPALGSAQPSSIGQFPVAPASSGLAPAQDWADQSGFSR